MKFYQNQKKKAVHKEKEINIKKFLLRYKNEVMNNSFKLIENEADLQEIKPFLKIEDFRNILIAVVKQQKYIFFTEIRVLINKNNQLERYVL